MPATSRPFKLLFVLFHLLALAPLWVVHYLPMVDLPQHVAQMSIAEHWEDPAYGYQEVYRINPYFAQRLAPALVSLAAAAFPLETAVKIVISLAVLAIPWLCLLWLGEVGGDPWWVLSVFPVCYGYPFYFGFLDFFVAIPFGLLLMLVGYRFGRRASLRRGLALVGLVYLLFFAHLLMLGFAGLVTAAIVVLSAPDDRVRWRGLGYLSTVVPAIGAWFFLHTTAEHNTAPVENFGGLTPDRILTVPSYVIGGFEGIAPFVVGLVLLATPWLAGGSPSRQPARWGLFGAAALFFLFGPHTVLGAGLIYQRFSAFLLPGLLVAFDVAQRPRPMRRFVAPVVAALWLASLTPRFLDFHRESDGFREVLASAEPHRRMLSIVDAPTSRAVPWVPYLHFGAWYQVEKGGVVDFSFAEFFPNRFKYRPQQQPDLPYAFGWRPGRFSWSRHGGERYDYFLVRPAEAEGDPGRLLFSDATTRIDVIAQSGDWVLYEQKRSSAAKTR